MNAPAELRIVNVHDAKTNFSRLLEHVQAGEEVIVAKAGKRMAKLVPIATDDAASLPVRKPGRYKGLLGGISDSVWFAPLPDDELDAWEGEYSDTV